LVLAKHNSSKQEDVGTLILPARRVHPRLDAGFFQKSGTIPSRFQGNLREQDTFKIAVLHQQPVLSDVDLLNIQHASQRRQNRDLIFEPWQL
jgi:hypothetical protein